MIVAILRAIVVEGVRAETVPEGSGLLFQGVGLRALLLEGVSGGTNAILSGSSGFEEVSLRLKLLAAVGVGGVQGGASSSSFWAAARASSRSLIAVAAVEAPEVEVAMGARLGH